MVNPRDIHFIEEKHVMRYLKGTLDYWLRYASSGEIKLHGYTDSDWEELPKIEKSHQDVVLIWDHA